LIQKSLRGLSPWGAKKNRSKLQVMRAKWKPSRSAKRLRQRNQRSPELKAVARHSGPADAAGEVDVVAVAEYASRQLPRHLLPREFLERR
jgi:hypothetical protein